MMDRHPTDFVELLFGLTFVATGAGFIVHQTTSQGFDAAWVAAVGLVTVGCALLAATLFRRPRPKAIDIPAVVPSEAETETETRTI